MDAGSILTTYGSLWSPALFAGLLALTIGLVWMAFAPATPAKAVGERLEGYLERPGELGDAEMERSVITRVFLPLLRRLVHWLGRFAPRRSAAATTLQLVQAGEPLGLTYIDWFGLRLLVSLLLSAGVLVVALPRYGLPMAARYALMAGLVGFLLTALWLRSNVNRRKGKIRRALPDALDMLTIGVEAGLAFESALLRVGEKWDNPLTRELKRAVGEMRVGTAREVALQRMAERSGVEELYTFVAILVQSTQLGVSIAEVLHAQAAEVRAKRRMRVEELAKQAGVKMVFPLALLILPSMFVVILGPMVPPILEMFRAATGNAP